MSTKKKLLIYIPVFNDFQTLPFVLDEILAEKTLSDFDVTLLVLDDGSSDYRNLDYDKAVLFYRLSQNLGLGFSLKIAMRLCLSLNFDYLLRIDADGQHPVSSISGLLSQLKDNDFCLTYRKNHNARVRLSSFLKTIVKSFYSFSIKWLTNVYYKDVNSGMFALSQKACRKLSSFEFHVYPEPQLIALAHLSKLSVSEYEIEQETRLEGVSSLGLFSALKMIYYYLIFVFSLFFRRNKGRLC
tara:strand:+ start:555 stop:1280 length:726 start_codon:yes stop_codon:yes gene_type:complete